MNVASPRAHHRVTLTAVKWRHLTANVAGEVPMFDVLLVSRPPCQRRPRYVLGSLFIHSLLLAAVVETTRASLEAPRSPVADTTLVFLRRLAPPVTKPEPPAEETRETRLVAPVPAPP